MKKKVLRIIAIMQIVIIMSLFNVVNASSFSFIAKAENEVINIGDIVNIQLTIDEIDAGADGINVVEMWLEYDKNVFEKLEFTEENDWRIVHNEENGKMLFVKMVDGVTQRENIGKINLKSKDNLEDIDTEIKLKEITSNDGNSLIDEGERVIKIRIEKPVIPTPIPTPTAVPTPTATPVPTETVAPTPTSTQTATPTNTPTTTPTVTPMPTNTPNATNTPIPTVKPTATPKPNKVIENIKTGDIKPIIAISIVIVVIVINVVYFIIRKKKNKKEDK